MSTVQAGDVIAVYRGGQLYHAPADMSTVQDTDLLVIGRGNVPYKCTFADWKNSQAKAPDVGSVVLADSPEAGRFTSATFASTVTMTEDGVPASTKGLKAWVGGSLSVTATTDTITKVEDDPTHDIKLTLASDKDLAALNVGDTVKMGAAADVPYKPVSDAIVKVAPNSPSAGQATLTLSGATDLDYFRVGDAVRQIATGDIIARTDAGDFFTDPDVDPAYGNIANVFGAGLNPSFTLIKRDNAWEEFTFLNPPTVTSSVQFRGGNYITGTRNFALFINGKPMINPLFGVNEWDTSSSYGTPVVVAFSGVMNTLRIEAVNGVSGTDGVGVGDIFIDAYDAANKITGTPGAGEIDQIISIDGTVPSITVDGGEWYADPANGGDGSGDSSGDTKVTCVKPLKAPTAWKVEAIDTTAHTLSLSHATPNDNAQVWVANDNQAGTGFQVAGTNLVAVSKLYLDFDAAGNVSDLQSADPGYVTMTGNSPYTLTFPATLPSGNAPDTDLPAGTTLTTEVEATNPSGSDAGTSNTITPA